MKFLIVTILLFFVDKNYAVDIPENIVKGDKTIDGEIVQIEEYDHSTYTVTKISTITFVVDPEQGINSDDFTILVDQNSTVEAFKIISNTNIEFLPIKVSEKFPNLQQYTGSVLIFPPNCHLKIISYENFKDLINLRRLKIRTCRIEQIQSGVFDDLISLEELRLEYNMINFIAEDAFKNLKNLEGLFLNENHLTTLSFSLGNNLKYLSINDSQVTSIPKEFLRNGQNLENFKGLINLRRLEIRTCRIEQIQSGVFDDLISLEVLLLDSNMINFIAEDAFKNLKNLEGLSLEKNQLTTLSFSLGNNLKYLSIRKNQVTSIPKGFLRNCQNLEYFDADSNNIESIHPATFKRLKNLKSVSLGHNCISYDYFSKHLEYIPSAFIDDNFRKLNHDIKVKCAPKDDGLTRFSLNIMECLLDFSIHKCSISKVIEKIVYLF